MSLRVTTKTSTATPKSTASETHGLWVGRGDRGRPRLADERHVGEMQRPRPYRDDLRLREVLEMARRRAAPPHPPHAPAVTQLPFHARVRSAVVHEVDIVMHGAVAP